MDDNLHMVFTGTEVEVLLLKGELEENGIASMVRDRLASSLRAVMWRELFQPWNYI